METKQTETDFSPADVQEMVDALNQSLREDFRCFRVARFEYEKAMRSLDTFERALQHVRRARRLGESIR